MCNSSHIFLRNFSLFYFSFSNFEGPPNLRPGAHSNVVSPLRRHWEGCTGILFPRHCSTEAGVEAEERPTICGGDKKTVMHLMADMLRTCRCAPASFCRYVKWHCLHKLFYVCLFYVILYFSGFQGHPRRKSLISDRLILFNHFKDAISYALSALKLCFRGCRHAGAMLDVTLVHLWGWIELISRESPVNMNERNRKLKFPCRYVEYWLQSVRVILFVHSKKFHLIRLPLELFTFRYHRPTIHNVHELYAWI
jgi:hypothetical protein